MSNFQFRIGETEDGKPVRMDLATLIESKLLDVANSGAGKSYLLRVLIERTAEKVQWIVIDPEGEYSTLREKFDFMLVGPDGELPVDVRSAGLLARKIMETRVSTIIDLYGLLEIRPQWAANFLNALMTLPKSLYTPVMVLIDEAHKFAPETPTGSKEERDRIQQSRRAVITLTDSGRKQSRGAAIATQRLSKLAADARGDLNNNFIGRVVQDLDRERAAEILGIRSRDSVQLRDLPPGTFFAFGPAFLAPGVLKVKIDQAMTRHPKAGERHLLDVPKASDALKHLVEQMGDLPARAQEESDTLERLQTENARLKRELAARPTHERVVLQEPRVEIQVVEKPVLNGELPRLEAIFARAPEIVEPVARVGDQLVAWGTDFNAALREVRDAINNFQAHTQVIPQPARQLVSAAQPLTPGPLKIVATTNALAQSAISEGLSTSQQRILDALAQFEALGLTTPHKSNVAVFADVSPTSSGYQNNLGRLRTLNYIEYPGSGRVSLTVFGRALANPTQAIRTLADLHQAWYGRLSRPQGKILSVVIAAYPHAVGKNDLAERAGQSATSSGYQNNLGALRSLGLIDYPRAGFVVATTLLFPDGLR